VPDVGEELERVRQMRDRARRTVQRILDREEHGLAAARSRPVLAAPYSLLDQRGNELGQLRDRTFRNLDHRIGRASDQLSHLLQQVRALSPHATLQRGYAIVQRADGVVVRAAADVAAEDELDVRLAEGRLTVGVKKTG